MQSNPFLKSIAEAYASKYDDLSDFLFVFPSKRAGTFFLTYLRDLSETPRVAPCVTSIAEFLSVTSRCELDSRIDLLFTLYDAYLNIGDKGSDREVTKENFNAFRMWGDVVISDFSAVDMSGVDAEKLFSNVRDHHEIQSSFMTEEQIQVLEEYFGVSYNRENLDRFWLSMDYYSPTDKEKRTTAVREKFLFLWEQLWPLYQEFNRLLDEKGMAYAGKAYKLALLNLKAGMEIPEKKIVFVGFNVLSKMEWLIFDELRKRRTVINGEEMPLADFIWDATGPVLGAEDEMADHSQSAVQFISRNRERFPEPEWLIEYLETSDTDRFPDVIELHSSPSDVMQAKIAGQILRELKLQDKDEAFENARIAMVLPDEWLLLPTLYSIPEEVGSINLTMGYPLKLTSVLSFMERVKTMQLRQRKVDDERGYFHEDITLLLGHPLAQKLVGPYYSRRIKEEIVTKKKFTMTESELLAIAPESAFLWRPLNKTTSRDAIVYLEEILEQLSNVIFRGLKSPKHEKDPKLKEKLIRARREARLEASHIAIYRDALHRLDDAIQEHKIEMNSSTLFTLVDRLLAAEQVTFKGEPLEGLQVMGLLETRCLDFDCLVIPSMSEKIFPMKMRSKTFIPDNLRRAYGMPPSNYEEAVFAYYFYRLISRASQVYMIHDARVGGLKSGDVSRYVLQLEHLYARGKVKRIEHSFSLTSPNKRIMRADKTGKVAAILDEYFDPYSNKHLSASALTEYMKCPMKFYFGQIASFNTDNPPTEFMDAATAGTIVHNAIEALYNEEDSDRRKMLDTPKIIDEKFLTNLLQTPDKIRLEVELALRKCYLGQKYEKEELKTDADKANYLAGCKELPQDAEISLELLIKQTEGIIKHDLNLTRTSGEIHLYGTEIDRTLPYPLTDERAVNVRFAIDRLDKIVDETGNRVWRVVDYKTGSVKITANEIAEIFDPGSGAKNIFQPQLYANLFNLMKNGTIESAKSDPVRMEIYNIMQQTAGKYDPSIPVIAKQKVLTHLHCVPTLDGDLNLNDEFQIETDRIIRELFDKSKPFTQCESDSSCTYCNFRPFCDR